MRVPVELTRLSTHTGADLGPFALLGGVTVSRRLRGAPPAGPTAMPGPLKVLAAVAAPDASRTPNPPLDVEAEMQAVLDAVQPVSDDATAQVRILEVASLDQIRRALDSDAYHVLHLSAHGSPTTIELEDEDGGPVEVGTKALVGALQDAGRPVPLIVLSSCSGAVSTQAMAAGLVAQGADRVIAMQAAVSDPYATALTAHLYADLVRDPAQPVAQALARARRAAESRPGDGGKRMPEYGVPMLLAAGPDLPLLDTDAAPAALAQPTVAPSGTSVRELPLGRLIGRRHELRRATAVLRRTPEVLRDLESVIGVQLLGIGGIGKTALAGRLISRLRGDGWAIAVHEGAWNPERLFGAVAAALEAPTLADPRIEDEQRLGAVLAALRDRRLLLVLDDFEQNLTRTGDEFLDPAFADVLDALTDACAPGTGGAVLVTSRHPVPGQDGSLVRIPLPPLSGAELRRLFLRLPGLNALNRDDQRLISRIIGGHPRLIEFVDALLRGHRAKFPEAQARLKRLAAEAGIDLTRPRPPGKAVDQALVLAAADVFLDILTGALSEPQRAALRQLAICQAPMSVEDLASALSLPVDDVAESVAGLTDLSLLTADNELLVHPWTARILVERMREEGVDFGPLHERAVDIRFQRSLDGRAGYDDLLDLPHHLAALGDYGGVLAIARRAVEILPGTLSAAAYLAEIQDLVPDREDAWIPISDLRLQQILASGDLRSATRLMQRIHDRIATRATGDPTNTDWQRDLSVSHSKLGDLARATGDGATAAADYEAGLAIAERLASTDPTNTDLQRDLSVSHERLGDLAVVTGDRRAAAEHQQAALTIAERLAATDPTNTDRQRDLAISHNKLGELAVATGDNAVGAEHYQTALAIAERLAATDPTNTDWQRNLSICHNRLGSLAAITGDNAAAVEHYRADLAIAERLAATDPTNTEWQRDLSISHNKLGDLARANSDNAAAAEHYQADLAIAERLAATDPTNTDWQRDLSISHERLGDLARATGDDAAAAEHFQASLTTRQRLAATDPTNTDWQRDLSISHNKLGDLAATTGDNAAAAEHFQAGLRIRQRLVDTDPTNVQWRQDLARLHARIRRGDVTVTKDTRRSRLRGRLRRDRGV
jgi:tetratricopeptide (TPR) repeat protein